MSEGTSENVAADPATPPFLTIRRVYNNGDILKQRLPSNQALEEIEYSKKWRPGCALFIGAECVQTGYLGVERCAALSAEISS